MHKIITIHVGQAGVKIGSAWWELYCLEHGIQPDGRLAPGRTFEGADYSVFSDEVSGRYVPRAVFVDFESTAVGEVRTGTYKDLFRPEQLITGKEDAVKNYARGYYSYDKEVARLTYDQIQHLAHELDDLQGFIIFRSYGGGTGSGFTSYLVEKLSRDFGKKLKVEFVIYPTCQFSASHLEPYNSVLTTHKTLEHFNCSIMVDNKAIHDICQSNLKIRQPTQTNINSLIAQTISSITASFRFGGTAYNDLEKLLINLAPYKRIHFSQVSYAPVVPVEKAHCYYLPVERITNACFESDNQMMRCNPSKAKYFSCCMMYRGDVMGGDVDVTIDKIKEIRKIQFVDQSNPGITFSIVKQPPTVVEGGKMARMPRTVCMLSNTTAITEAFARVNREFDFMYAKRDSVHQYVLEGMEESEFSVAREDLTKLENEYKEQANKFSDGEGEGTEEYKIYALK